MTSIAMLSMILITLALVFYSIGVWSERIAGRLKGWHLIFFWGGLSFDTIGTGMMMDMAGGITLDIHGVTGVLAILLMVVHAVWATAVLLRKDERAIVNFHRFSVLVWAIWLIPYFTGFFVSMAA
ncbi:MAG: HsmA family protein [Anaerolineae bacterium]